MKYKTVREGEQAVVLNYRGEGRHLVGPQRVFLFRERLQYLRQYTADEYQYLAVTNNYGFTQHIPGPCSMFHNPLENKEIYVKDATKIDANHSVVVYKQSKGSKVERRIIQGPTVFVPTAEEWVHEFKWHGPDPNEKGHMISGLTVLKQLPCIPDQFYYNVRDVRTTDDTMLTVKLMIFYQLQDIIKMLEATHDPIADMINAVCADVIAFVGALTYDQFLQQSQGMSELESYPQLIQRSEKIGYCVSKVVYRGYTASTQLQAMQDNAIQSRTQLRLNSELENQRQKLADFKLTCEQSRTKIKHEMDMNLVNHKQILEKMKQDHQLSVDDLIHTAMLKKDGLTEALELEKEDELNTMQQDHLQKLKDLGVDLTEYLVNQQGVVVDQQIQVITDNSNTARV